MSRAIWSLVCVLQCVLWMTRTQELPRDFQYKMEEFNRELQEAALEVLQQREEPLVLASDERPEPFDMPDNFMHSYRPHTAVGNREDLVIDKIVEVPLFDEKPYSTWRYLRFNNSDYVLARDATEVLLWKKNINISEPFVFSSDEAIFRYPSGVAGSISDATIFIRRLRSTDVLYVAILRDAGSSILNVYEIADSGISMGTVIDLGFKSYVGLLEPRSKLTYLESKYGSSLVVLVANTNQENVVYRKKGTNVLNHYIELHFPSAVDMVSFTAGGHGYVAVANRTVCVVFKMDEFVEDHIEFDRIYFESDIVDLEFFRMGFHRYLTISSANYQAFFVWRSGEFAKSQDFFIPGVQQVFGVLLPNCRDDVIMLFVKDETPPVFFIWSGQQEKFVPVIINAGLDFLPAPNTMMSLSYGSTALLLYVNKHGKPILAAIITHLNPVSDPILLIGKEVSDMMQELQYVMEQQERTMHSMSAVLANAVKSTGVHSFTNLQAFNDITSTEGIVADVPVHLNNIVWEGSRLTLSDYLVGTEDIENRVASIEKEIEELERLLPEIIRVDEDAVITGSKVFAGDVQGSSIIATSLNVQSLGGIDLPQLQRDIYRLDKPSTIEGILTFEKPLFITSHLNIETTINGIDLSTDVLTTNTDQKSNAQMIFDNKLIISGNLAVSGRINDIDVGMEVVTLDGDHVVTGKKHFTNGIVANNVWADYIDGVHVSSLFDRALTVNGSQTITGTKHFHGALRTHDISLHGTLNNYIISDLVNSIVRTDVETTIEGHKMFLGDVHIQNSLTVGGTINGMRFPDDLFLKNSPNVVTGRKDFLVTVSADHVVVHGTVNGLSLPTDIITLSKDEEIDNTLIFTDGITVESHIIVHGLVDGVDVSELAKKALKASELTSIQNAVFKGPVHILGNLDVQGQINGVSLKDLVGDIVFKTEKNVVIEAPKTFRKLTAGAVRVNKLINGYDLQRDFMTIHGDQEIHGTKVFKKSVTFHDLSTADGMIGGVDIKRLYENRISLSIEEEFEGDLEFVDHLIIDGSMIVRGTLGGLRFPEDFVLKSSTQTISNKIFYGHVAINELNVAGDTIVEDTFGGVNLQEFWDQRVTLSTDQDIFSDIVLGTVTATQVDISGPVNGMDIVDFANNVMSLSRDQNITAYKEFIGRTEVLGSMTTVNGINGINLSDINERAFKLHGDNVVTAPVTFTDDVTFTYMEVGGLVNGINLTELDQNSVKKEGLQYITGTTIFNKGFHVEGDITATAVNGLNLPEDILTKHTQQTIRGIYTLNNVIVNGNMEVHGLVNGMDLSAEASLLAKIDLENIIHSDVVFTSTVHVTNDIEVSGLVNGIDIGYLERAALKATGDQHIPGHKVFKGTVTVYGDVDVGTINGMPWAEFLKNVVRIDVPQTITGLKVFETDLEVTGDVHVSGTANIERINDVDLRQFVNEVVFIDRPATITGKKVFTNTVEIAGNLTADLVNNLRLKTDVITLQCGDPEPQVITGEKTFQNLDVYGDIYVEGTVNGYKLDELVRDTLTTDGNQVITGHMTFHKPVTFRKNLFPSTVNGIVLHRDLVTLDTDQTITGDLIFKNNVHVNEDLEVSGLLNGMDINELAKNALYVDTQQDIEGAYTIEHAVVQAPIFVKGTVNDIHLSRFAQNVSNFWSEKKQDLKQLQINTAEHCENVNYLHSVLEHSYHVLDGFNMHQMLNLSANDIDVGHAPADFSLINFAESSQVAEWTHFQWFPEREIFQFHSVEESGVIKQKVYKLGRKELTIYFGLIPEDTSISVNKVNIPSISGGFSDADAIVYNNKAIVALLYPGTRIIEVHEIAVKGEVSTSPLGSLHVQGATSIVAFEIANTLHLAVSCDFTPNFAEGFSGIYAWDRKDWRLIQNVMASASAKIVHFSHYGYHYLVFSNTVPVFDTKEPQAVQVYRNTGRRDTPFELFQKVPFDNAKGLEIFEFGALSELYMMLANETRVQVFLLEGESGFNSNYVIHGECITAVKPIMLDTEIYLVVAQKSRGLPGKQTTVIFKGLTQGSTVPPRKLKYCS